MTAAPRAPPLVLPVGLLVLLLGVVALDVGLVGGPGARVEWEQRVQARDDGTLVAALHVRMGEGDVLRLRRIDAGEGPTVHPGHEYDLHVLRGGGAAALLEGREPEDALASLTSRAEIWRAGGIELARPAQGTAAHGVWAGGDEGLDVVWVVRRDADAPEDARLALDPPTLSLDRPVFDLEVTVLRAWIPTADRLFPALEAALGLAAAYATFRWARATPRAPLLGDAGTLRRLLAETLLLGATLALLAATTLLLLHVHVAALAPRVPSPGWPHRVRLAPAAAWLLLMAAWGLRARRVHHAWRAARAGRAA